MKKVDATTTKRDFDELVSILSEEAILDLHAMSHVRGGDGDGGADIILMPPKPPQGT